MHLTYDAKPRFFVLYRHNLLQEEVRVQLHKLVAEGILEPVHVSQNSIECATPRVIVMKSNERVRICEDFPATINPCVIKDDYALLRFDDLAADLLEVNISQKLIL